MQDQDLKKELPGQPSGPLDCKPLIRAKPLFLDKNKVDALLVEEGPLQGRCDGVPQLVKNASRDN